MNWYYVEVGQPVGPIEDAQLDALRREGRITDETMIFCEGMTAWQPFRVARAGAAAPSANPWAPGRTVCHECGKLFPTSEMIRHEPYYICAACKPMFMQKLSEGATLHTGDLRYAGFWIRFAAIFLDALIIGVVEMCLLFALGAAVIAAEGDFGSRPVMLLMNFALYGFGFGLYLLYFGLLVAKYGATPGKMACGLRVVSSDGSRMSTARAFGRACAWLLSYWICYIGFIIAAFDDEKRALHDRICDTRVIYK